MPHVFLDAVLEPPRSLSPKGFDRVMLALAVFCGLLSAGFMLAGAYPVAGFLGLDVLGIWLVFRANFRAQRQRTFLRVTAESVDVRKVDAKGRERRARLPSGFARVEGDAGREGLDRLRLAVSNRRYEIGEYLTPRERSALAKRLRQALAEARLVRPAPFDGDDDVG